MTITSTFYDTSTGVPASLVTEVKWANAHPQIGSSTYGVDGLADFAVTAHPTTPYAVNIAPGKAWGHGVLDVSDAIGTVVCATPSSGTSRWDLICLHRDWTPAVGGPTVPAAVQGGTTKAIPSARATTPGTQDDQPLALVQWTSGHTQPTALVDLRCWAGNGGMLAVDAMALGYLNQLGAQVTIGGVEWKYVVASDGITTQWVKAGELYKLPIFGFTPSALAGIIPAGMSDALIQAGTTVNYFDSSGYARIVWPRPFPTGLLFVIGFDGDDWATGGSNTYASAGSVWGAEGFGTASSWVYAGRSQPASATGSGSLVIGRSSMAGRIHRINWLAIGF